MSDILWSRGLYPARLLSPWNSPGNNNPLQWVVIPFSRGSSRPRDQTQVSTAGRFFTGWASREAQQLDIAKFPSIETVQTWIFPSNIRKCMLPSFVVVQLLSCVWLFETPWTAARQASPSFTTSWSLLKLMSIESVMPSNHLILCRPLLLLPSIFSSIRVSSNESVLHIRWPKPGFNSTCFCISSPKCVLSKVELI